MSHPTIGMLDQDELFQLARNASAAGDSPTSIAYLKEAVARPNATSRAHYLLGAEYAQIGMYERAVDAMESALALDPSLSIARMQLGMLWLTAGDVVRAESTLAPLGALAADDALRQFGAGLCHLIHDRSDAAVACIEAGIALNTAMAPLNDDMQLILETLARLRAPAVQSVDAHSAAAPAGEDSQHILLSAYTGNTSH